MEHQLKVGDRVMFRPYFDEPGFIYGRLDHIFERDSRVISDAGDIWFTMTEYLRKANEAEHNFTKGPWVTDTSHKDEWEGIAVWSDDVVIAHVIPDQHKQHESNANLIAAAPDLLKALEWMEKAYHAPGVYEGDKAIKFAQNTIQKALGVIKKEV